MANFTERLRIVLDMESSNVTKGMKKLRDDLKSAEGAAAKAKVALKGLGDILSSPAGVAAGAAAAGAFALKAAHDFEAMAKQAIDLGKATGLSTEEASRWIAVGDDFGLTAENLTAGIGRIAKTLDKKVWADYGIATRDAAGNARDMSLILEDALAKISATTNETERARMGTELFGKGFANLAPLIGHTREEYDRMLKSVESGQVITAAEAAKAEKLRLAEDALQDSFKEVTLAVGEFVSEMAPFIQATGESITWVTDLIDKVSLLGDTLKFVAGSSFGPAGEAVALWDSAVSGAGKSVDITNMSLEQLQKFLSDNKFSTQDATDITIAWKVAHKDLADSIDNTGATVEKSTGAIKSMADQIMGAAGVTKAMNDEIAKGVQLQSSYTGVVDSLANMKSVLDDGKSGWVEQRNAITGAKSSVLDYLDKLGGVPPDKRTEILALIDQGNFTAVNDALNSLTKARQIPVTVKLAWDFVGGLFGGGATEASASAGAQAGQSFASDFAKAVASAAPASPRTGGGGKASSADPVADARKKARDIEDAKYEMGLISESRYKQILKRRLTEDEKYSDSYMDTWRKIKQIDDDNAAAQKKKEEEAAKAKVEAEKKKKEALEKRRKAEKEAAEAAKKAADEELARAANRAIVAANIGGATYLTINTAADPNAVVNAIQQYNRKNGPAPIKVQ